MKTPKRCLASGISAGQAPAKVAVSASECLFAAQRGTEQGKLIDDALGAFLTRWPSEDLTED